MIKKLLKKDLISTVLGFTLFLVSSWLIIYIMMQFITMQEKFDHIEEIELRTIDTLKELSNRINTNRTYVTIDLESIDYRIKMLSSEVLNNMIDIDGISHESCESKFEELYRELELIRKGK